MHPELKLLRSSGSVGGPPDRVDTPQSWLTLPTDSSFQRSIQSFHRMKIKSLVRLIEFLSVCLCLALSCAGCKSTGEVQSKPSANQIFDEHTSGKTLVEAGLKQAKAENKDVILLFGANWCPFCRQLHGLIENDPAVHSLVQKRFVVVPLDVGTSAHNRNVSLIDKYGSNVFTDGTPSVVVLNADGRRLAPTKDNPWSAKNPIEASRVIGFLERAGSMN